MRVDVEADPKVVEAAEAVERYLVGKADMTWEYEAGARTDMMTRIGPETGSSAKAHPEAW